MIYTFNFVNRLLLKQSFKSILLQELELIKK